MLFPNTNAVPVSDDTMTKSLYIWLVSTRGVESNVVIDTSGHGRFVEICGATTRPRGLGIVGLAHLPPSLYKAR